MSTRGPVMYPTRDAAMADPRPDCVVVIRRRGAQTWWSIPQEALAEGLARIEALEDTLHAARARATEGPA